MAPPPFTIRSVQAFCYRYPLSTPVVTSFGRMLNRPAVFVRVEDVDGIAGWGEVWSNFPSSGAEHRARLVNEVLAPAILNVAFSTPSDVFARLTQGTSVLALQSGEPGPFAQAIAGIDLAVWDMHAKRQRSPLWKLLGGHSATIRVYASGINPTGSQQMAEAALRRGHRALKLKVGFEPDADRANLAALRRLVGDGMLAADANQAWSVAKALEIAPRFAEFGLAWLEEPIRADRPWQEWRDLRRALPMPLAAGENIASHSGFAHVLGDDVLRMTHFLVRHHRAFRAQLRRVKAIVTQAGGVRTARRMIDVLMRFPPRVIPPQGNGLKAVGAGVAYAFRQREIRASLVLVALVSAFGASYLSLLPAFARDVLHQGSEGLGFLYSAVGLGALLGAYTLARVPDRHLFLTPVVSAAGFGVFLMLFSGSQLFWLSLALLMPAAFSLMLLGGSTNTIIQLLSRDDMRGRVVSLYAIAFMGVMPWGSLTLGWIAERFSLRVAVFGGGLVCLAAALGAFYDRKGEAWRVKAAE